jgi:hypothetical protein
VGFLIVKLLPLPVALHPEFRDVESGKMHHRSRWKLQTNLVDDEGCVRRQRNEFEAKQCVVENVAICQFIDGLDFGALSLCIDFDALLVFRQHFAVRFLVLILDRLPLGLDFCFEHLFEGRLGGDAAGLTAFGGFGLWGGLLRRSQGRHCHDTSEDQEISHSSSKANAAGPIRFPATFWVAHCYCNSLTFFLTAASNCGGSSE